MHVFAHISIAIVTVMSQHNLRSPCYSVLDWNAYERYNKSEPVVGQGGDGE